MKRPILSLCAAATLGATLACQPKPPPPKLPPKEVPRLQGLQDNIGQRGSVVDDAVQIGSNQAKIAYDCGPPYGKGIDGKGVLAVEATRCEADTAQKTVTLSGGGSPECPDFLIAITDYKGVGTYNTSTMGKLSFGLAKARQPACNWEGSVCLNWDRQAGVHPEATCTVEVNSDGGLQYGTSGATISGTFVCSAFVSPWKGCAGVSAVAGCGITRGSFSISGCTATASPAQAPPPKTPAKGKRGH